MSKDAKGGKKVKKGGSKAKKGVKGKGKGKGGSKLKVGSKTKASGSKTAMKKKGGSKSKSKVNKSKSVTKTAKAAAAPVPPANPETVAKNKALLDKIVSLMSGIKADQITRTNKDDLDKVQTLIKNISFRDGGQPSRVRDVDLSENQKAIIKMVSGDVDLDEMDHLMMTVTDAKDTGSSVAVKSGSGPPKLNFPFEKLEFVPTKS